MRQEKYLVDSLTDKDIADVLCDFVSGWKPIGNCCSGSEK
jgi:hypothetical protein